MFPGLLNCKSIPYVLFSSFLPTSEEEISLNFLMLPLLLIYLLLLASSIFLSLQFFFFLAFKHNQIIIILE